tara:strand:+ start:299 stop:562 length:264 start_codon:yes stop_codon:yes gene_type:complete
MKTLHLDEFSENGIIKEISFRQKIEDYNWKKLNNKKVLIKGCSEMIIPTWAYLIIAAKLTEHASHILYGEGCSAVKIYKQSAKKHIQ